MRGASEGPGGTGGDRLARIAGGAALALAGGTLAAWIAELAGIRGGDALPAPVDRALVLATLSAGLLWAVVAAMRALSAPGERRRRTVVLLILLALAVGMELSTIDFELMTHARNDEGVYVAVAEDIQSGEPFPVTFNYGHFLYYAGAYTLWLYELFPQGVTGITSALYDAERPVVVKPLLLRAITATLGALTVVPVFWIAYRLAGLLAAGLAGMLLLCSPIYLETSVFSISDGPSGFFATLCLMFVASLAVRERWRDYLLAGVAAGLAAGSKYPGGVSALAIVAVWAVWRFRERRWSWHLVGAAAAAMASMLAVMPGLVARRDAVFVGRGLDILFGFRQYAYGGWIGVVPESTTLWYVAEVADNFGWAVLLAGLSGLFVLGPETRRRLLVVLPFPAAYLVLICSMNMVVQRNLLPALPALAAFLGVGLAGWTERLRALSPGWRRLAPWLPALVLAVPVADAAAWTVRRNRPSTGEIAVEWIVENLPEGAAFLREDYTPGLDPRRHPSQHRRFAPRFTPEEMADPDWDYLLLSRNAYLRFLDPAKWSEAHHGAFAERYRELFELEEVRDFRPSRLRAGALVRLFRLDPERVDHLDRRRFSPGEASWLSDEALRFAGPEGPLRYTRRWQFALFKEYLLAGRYRAILDTQPPASEGYLYVVSRENDEVGTFATEGEIVFELPRDAKFFFKVFLVPGAVFHGLSLAPAG